MQLPSQYSSSMSKVPLKHSHSTEDGCLPHIKTFERDNRYDTFLDGDGITSSLNQVKRRKQAALAQSKKIFGPFRYVPRKDEKTPFFKNQEKSFIRSARERGEFE